MSLRKPIKIGKYEVVGLLGKGGMGVVYKATDPLLGRSVAIKMMTTVDYVDNPDLLQRFYREAQSTGNLHHRNIVTVYELGDQEGSPYLVMEYLEGETLDAIIQSQRPLTLLDRINFIVEVCDGLAYAHQRAVVHRDIKPGNIMVLKDREVKIVDFGIAHIGNRTVTRTGQLLGSLPYMSPEQISGKSVDARTDIFSLGVVFYQLLTGHLPFEGETPAATLLKIMHERPRPLREYEESLPPELDDILMRALAKDREERYTTAQDLAFDLVQIRGRIQQEIVEEHLNQAESFLAREELLKAREKLNEVLKIDRHNTRGVELSRAVQQRIQQQEAGEQVRQLRSQAEDAYQKEQFSLALELIQKALHLHSTDPDLQRLRSSVQQAKTNAEQLQRALKRAESAYEQGELDSAKQAIEEALALAPDDVHAKSLYRTIQRDWTQRAQRLQVQSLIGEARKELASRNFTLALEVLRKAEAIDPETPELQALIEAAHAAREQERRRKALDTAKREIEADLDRDDFQQACTRAEAALQEFPDDRGLQKLKVLADKQRQLAERKLYIEEQVSRARKLLEAGRTDEVLELLQAAKQTVGTDPHLDSLLVVVRDTLERQRTEARKQEFLRRAKDQLRLKQYSEVIRTLEGAQAELGSNPEIDDLLQFTVEQQSAETRRQIADAAAEKAQALVTEQDYEKAVEVLEGALQEAPDEELRIVLVQVRHAAADHRKLMEDALANTESMIQGQRPVEALKYLQSQPASFSRDPRFGALLEKARQQATRLQQIEQALEKARVHLARDEFDAAHAVLDDCVRSFGRTPELNKLLAEIEQRQTQAVADTLEKALAEGRALMGAGKPDQAIERLSSVQTIVGKVSPKLSGAYQSLQQEAANAQVRKYKSEVEQLLAKGEHDEAASLLSRAQSEFPQNRELHQTAKALEQAVQRRAEGEKLLARAQELFQSQLWRDGADTCLRTASLSTRDPALRNRALAMLQSAAFEAVDKEWRHAEFLLQCMSQLQANISLPAAIQDKIASSRQEESVRELVDEAGLWRERGDLSRALDAVRKGLSQFPAEPRLARLQDNLQKECREKEDLARREQEQKDKEAYIAGIRRRLRRESTVDGRVRIFQEALQKYSGDPGLQNELAQAKALGVKVDSLVAEAQGLEASRKYDEAARAWSALSELGVSHPDAEAATLRLRRLEEEARSAAKSAWMRAIRDSLAAYHLDGAGSLLADAQKEFRNDPDLAELASRRDQLQKQREAGLRLLSQAQAELRGQRWRPASDLVLSSLHSAPGDPSVSTSALDTLVQASHSALSEDVSAAEMFLEHAARIQPNSPQISTLRSEVDRQLREDVVNRRLADARAVAEAGDAEQALSVISHAHSDFPDEPRFLALKQELERDVELEKKAQADRNRLLEILEIAQGLREEGDLQGSLIKVKEGLQAFPNHSQLLEMKASVESAIRELEEKQLREEKQRRLQLEEEQRRQEEEKKKQERAEERRRQADLAAQRAAAEEAERSRRKQEAERKAREEEEKKRQREEAKKLEQEKKRLADEAARQAAAQEAERKKQQQEAERKAREEAKQKQKAAKVAEIPVAKRPKEDGAQVWRGAALPVEVAKPQPVPAARMKSASESAVPARPVKIYIAIGVMLAALAVLTPAVWKAAHHPAPPAPATVAVQIITMPSGATVRVPDSGASCVSPQCNLDLTPGSHDVEISLSGYQSLKKSISVDPKSGGTITLGLVAVPPASGVANAAPSTTEAAHLELHDVPPGTEVVLDQRPAGRVGRRGTLSINVSPGNHQVQLQARNRLTEPIQKDFSSGNSVRLSSSDFATSKAPETPQNPTTEQAEWAKLKDSQNIQALDEFLKRYPKGAYSGSAESKLEDLYWAKAGSTGSASGYSQYLERFPAGKYSQQAQNQIATLDWHAVENSSDTGILQNFLKKYPSGIYHDKAAAKLDDLGWQRTVQSDPASLKSYISNFPDGRHATEARKKVDDLNRVASAAHPPEPHPTQTVVIDDNKAILDVLSSYQKAYEAGDLQGLQRVWPGMPAASVQSLGDFFRQATGVSLQYQVKQLDINGDHATLRFNQSIRYSVDGRLEKNSAKINMQLSRASGSPGGWHIDSIR
ncbi:MAG TPA: protein kinase [Terriglobales bacterium]|nr:protein kinase [Terriglobales bacterium]